jgi:RNA polymerase sigma-70 factor (ECF subfamily)
VENFVTSRFSAIDSDAVLSKTFEIAWRRFEEIPPDATRGWLIAVARNCARNELRGTRRRLRHVDALANAVRHSDREPPQISNGTIEAFRDAFNQLSEADREVLLLAEWDGLLGADLAAAIGTSKSTAAVRLHRARARLRTTFATEDGTT